MHAATLALLTKNATIFWEHEVFLDCCHSNTAIYIFFKKCENNGKNISFNLGFIDKFFILSSVCYYSNIYSSIYMPICELKFGIKYDLLP